MSPRLVVGLSARPEPCLPPTNQPLRSSGHTPFFHSGPGHENALQCLQIFLARVVAPWTFWRRRLVTNRPQSSLPVISRERNEKTKSRTDRPVGQCHVLLSYQRSYVQHRCNVATTDNNRPVNTTVIAFRCGSGHRRIKTQRRNT